MLKKLVIAASIAAPLMAQAAESIKLIKDPTPHFYLQMENQSDKDAAISFQQDVGSVSLAPELANHTALPAHQQSTKYAVIFGNLSPTDTFNVVFSGKKDCTYKIGFFAPANPTVSVSGFGCKGGGYKIVDGGTTLLLYISDVRLK